MGRTTPGANDTPHVVPLVFLNGTTTAVAVVLVAFSKAMHPADVPAVGIVNASV